MIRIDDRRSTADEPALNAPGGFIWWYLDLVDESGDGLVVIWSFGLPFLPGYASAAARGTAPKARERPSLNVAVYSDGELDCYLLQEYDRDEVTWDADAGTWQFDRSHMRIDHGEEELSARIDLDCAVPGSEDRLTGTIRAEGPALSRHPDERGAESADDDSVAPAPSSSDAHDWVPLAVPAEGRAELEMGDEAEYVRSGRAYLDHNRGTKPLGELGITRWLWGRVPLPERELVFYRLWPEGGDPPVAFARVFDREGGCRFVSDFEVDVRDAERNAGGLRWWRRIALEGADLPRVELACDDVVDSGPFYMRFLTRAATGGATVRGVSELIRPDRIDEGMFRPLVRMRVHDARSRGRRNSMWLPLFTGPKSGRLRRFFRHNAGGWV